MGNGIDKLDVIEPLAFLGMVLLGLIVFSISALVKGNKGHSLLDTLLIALALGIVVSNLSGGVDNTSTIDEASRGLKGDEVYVIDGKKNTIGEDKQLEVLNKHRVNENNWELKGGTLSKAEAIFGLILVGMIITRIVVLSINIVYSTYKIYGKSSLISTVPLVLILNSLMGLGVLIDREGLMGLINTSMGI